MIVVALLIDGIQFLLSLTVLLLPFSLFFTFLAAAGFGIWFALCGVKYTSGGGKKLLTGLAATVTELVPVINAIPATSAGVIAIIVQTRIEDARASVGGKVTPRTAMAQARQQRMRASRANRESSAREGREEVQNARHSEPANDNAPEAANDNSGDSYRNAA